MVIPQRERPVDQLDLADRPDHRHHSLVGAQSDRTPLDYVSVRSGGNICTYLSRRRIDGERGVYVGTVHILRHYRIPLLFLLFRDTFDKIP